MKTFSVFNDYSKVERFLAIALVLLLFIHLCFKAMWMGVFMDELITFYNYVQPGNLFPPDAIVDANNHFLNTGLTYLSYQAFGHSPLALRLPNLLSYLLFAYSLVGIAGHIRSKLVRWSLLSGVLMCLFIYDYFAMSRGYGIGMAFFCLAIYQVFLFQKNSTYQRLMITCVSLWLAIAANLTLLVYALFILGYLFFMTARQSFRSNRTLFWRNTFIIILSVLSFFVFIWWSFELKVAGALNLGSLESFHSTTVRTLSEHLFGAEYLLFALLFYTAIAGCLLTVALKILSSKSIEIINQPAGFLSILLAGSLILIFAMAFILEVNYPRDRAAMPLLFLIILAFATGLDILITKKFWIFALPSTFLLVFPIQFILHFHPANSQNFDSGRHSDELFNYVTHVKNPHQFPLSISARGIQQMSWYYCAYRSNKNQPLPYYSHFPQLTADIILKEPIDTAGSNLIYALYDSVYHDPFTQLTCFKRKTYLKRELLEEYKIPSINSSTTDYATFLTISADSLKNKSLLLGLDLQLETEQAPFRSRIIVSIDGAEPNSYYEYIDLNWLRQSYDTNNSHIRASIPIYQVPADAKTLNVYLWNQDMSMFSIREGKCYLYELD